MFDEGETLAAYHSGKVVEAVDLRRRLRELLVERVGNVVRRIRRNDEHTAADLRQLHG